MNVVNVLPHVSNAHISTTKRLCNVKSFASCEDEEASRFFSALVYPQRTLDIKFAKY